MITTSNRRQQGDKPLRPRDGSAWHRRSAFAWARRKSTAKTTSDNRGYPTLGGAKLSLPSTSNAPANPARHACNRTQTVDRWWHCGQSTIRRPARVGSYVTLAGRYPHSGQATVGGGCSGGHGKSSGDMGRWWADGEERTDIRRYSAEARAVPHGPMTDRTARSGFTRRRDSFQPLSFDATRLTAGSSTSGGSRRVSAWLMAEHGSCGHQDP